MVESDEEQIEQLKNWWDENGNSLIFTVVLALGGIFGFRAWEANVQQTGEAASEVYENLINAADNLSADEEAMRATAQSLSETLRSDYTNTTYAVFGALHMARIAVDSDDLDAAVTELEWALDSTEDPRLETMIRVRLARVLTAKGDATAALALLINHVPEAGQLVTFEEVRGDIYHALGDMSGARESYEKALAALSEGESRPILELKLADIPVAVSAPATADEDA